MKKSIILTSDGVITLIATLLGVFLALYLNEWNTSRKLKKEKETATENILQEINSNIEMLTETVKGHSEMFEIMSFMVENINKNEEIITSKEKMAQFRNDHPNIIIVKDSIKLDNGNYKYTSGQINFNISLPQIALKTLAWETLKNSNVISTYSFDCLMSLEYVYKLTYDVSQRNQKLFDIYMLVIEDYEGNIGTLLDHLGIILHVEKSLINVCGESPEKLKNCS